MRLFSTTTFIGPYGGAPVPSMIITLRMISDRNGPRPSPARRAGAGRKPSVSRALCGRLRRPRRLDGPAPRNGPACAPDTSEYDEQSSKSHGSSGENYRNIGESRELGNWGIKIDKLDVSIHKSYILRDLMPRTTNRFPLTGSTSCSRSPTDDLHGLADHERRLRPHERPDAFLARYAVRRAQEDDQGRARRRCETRRASFKSAAGGRASTGSPTRAAARCAAEAERLAGFVEAARAKRLLKRPRTT